MPADALPPQRHLFDLPDDVTYLNAAYLGPVPRATAEAGRAAVDAKLRPWGITPRHFFDPVSELRALVARLVGADEDGIALNPAGRFSKACERSCTKVYGHAS